MALQGIESGVRPGQGIRPEPARENASWWAAGATAGTLTAAASLGPSMFERGGKLQVGVTIASALGGFLAGTAVEGAVRAGDSLAPGDRLQTQLAAAGAGLAVALAVHGKPGPAAGNVALTRTLGWTLAAGGGAGAAATAIRREDLPAGSLLQVAPGLAVGAGLAAVSRHDMKLWKLTNPRLLEDAKLPSVQGAGRLLDPRPEGWLAPTVTGAGNPELLALLGAKGQRFVREAPTPAEINHTMGISNAVQPGRGYVGLDQVPKKDVKEPVAIERRAELLADEGIRLIKQGAAEDGGRRYDAVTLFATTSSGFINPTAVVAQEMAHHGRHLSLGVQAGTKKAAFEMRNLDRARQTYERAAQLLQKGIQELPAELRPATVNGYGESFGVLTLDGVMRKRPLDDLKQHLGFDRAMLTGPPARTWWTKAILDRTGLGKPGGGPAASADGSVLLIRNGRDALALPTDAGKRAKLTILRHDADPVSKFIASLAYDPRHLRNGVPRGEGVANEQRWFPITSLVQLAVDQQNAQYFKAGTLEAKGHDYRSEVALAARRAFNHEDVSDTQVARIREYSRQAEVAHAAAAKASAPQPNPLRMGVPERIVPS